MLSKSLIDHPKELLELIADCLKPKDIEKKKFMETNRAIDIIGMLFLICYEIYDINMPISSMIGCII